LSPYEVTRQHKQTSKIPETNLSIFQKSRQFVCFFIVFFAKVQYELEKQHFCCSHQLFRSQAVSQASLQLANTRISI
ncbi:MAG: hypothetical protein J1F68_06410, partial [Clostridiales bacterium]|nr:hypothetical protein [Clostridiales bacterium]